MKWKRSERLVDMTHYLLEHPQQLIPLTFFAESYQSAKSSISEDLSIVKDTFEERGIGHLITVPGAAGGVKYIPKVPEESAKKVITELIKELSHSDRLLPGGYLFMTDLLGNPELINKVGKVFASAFCDQEIDVIMTVATKGISIAHAIARHLNVPVVVVRRDNKVTEGSTVSIKYVSGSSRRIQTMVLSKRSMKSGQRVLITDDFMKVGGTMNGMKNLLEEFDCTLAGIAVLVEAEHPDERLVDDYYSLVKLREVNEKDRTIELTEGNYFSKGGNLVMKVVATNNAPAAIGPYVQGVIVNNMFYSSGQIPLTADGSLVEGTITEQTNQVFENLKAVLAEAGSSLDKVVKTMVFISDMNEFGELNEEYARHFGDHKPARSCVEVARLPKDVKVEIEVIALV